MMPTLADVVGTYPATFLLLRCLEDASEHDIAVANKAGNQSQVKLLQINRSMIALSCCSKVIRDCLRRLIYGIRRPNPCIVNFLLTGCDDFFNCTTPLEFKLLAQQHVS